METGADGAHSNSVGCLSSAAERYVCTRIIPADKTKDQAALTIKGLGQVQPAFLVMNTQSTTPMSDPYSRLQAA